VIRPLILKELREHRWVLLALWLFGTVSLIGLTKVDRDAGSPLAAFRGLTLIFGSLSILALANRLVVREFSGRTQLFLETLPVSRAGVIAVKWLLGAALVAAPMVVGLAVSLHSAAGQTVLTPRFVALVAARSFTFLLFGYSLAFLIGLTGRYRFLLWGALFIGAFAADSYAQLPVQQWSPLQLVTESMVFERSALPLADLSVTLLMSALLVAMTFALAVASEGSLVVALSQRMSPREKVVIAVALIGLSWSIGLMEARKPKPAFALHDVVGNETESALVAIARADRVSDATSRLLGARMSADLRDLRDYLSLSKIPKVFVLPDASIDSDIYQRAELPGSDGVVLRGAINSTRFDQEQFRAYALEQILEWYSHKRATQEERLWLLDGFAQWQGARSSASRQELLTVRAAVAGRIMNGDAPGLESALGHWLKVREQLGDCLSDALAWRAVTLLAEELGADRFRALMTALFGKQLPDDGRAPLRETSVVAVWRQTGAPAPLEFSRQFQSALQLDQSRLTDKLAAIAIPAAEFRAERMGGRVFEVHYRLGSDSGPVAAFSVRYGALGPWEREVDRERLARVDATSSGVLPSSFQSDTRLFTAIELRDTALGCTIRVGARRWDVR
jgi:hypothetical protein